MYEIVSQNNSRLSKSFCVLFSLITILNGYSSGIGSFSIGMIVFTFFSIIGVVILFIRGGRILLYNAITMLFFLYLLLNTLIVSGLPGNTPSSHGMFNSIMRLGVWVVIISLTSVHLGDYLTIKKCMINVAIISTVYLIIQSIAYYILRIRLTNVFSIGFLRPNYDYYEVYSLYGTTVYRPAGFFSEPSFLGYYILMVLTLVLFDGVEKPQMKLAFFLSLSAVLSTSSSAIYLCAVVWVIYIIRNSKRATKIFWYIVLIGVVPISLYILQNINWASLSTKGPFFSMMSESMSKIFGMTRLSRVGKSFDYLNLLKGVFRVIGVGVGNESSYITGNTTGESVYMNSLTGLFFWGGTIGCIVFFLMNIAIIQKSKNMASKVLLALYLIGGLYSGMYFSLQGIMYLSLVSIINNKGVSP